jgi:hypothetical protein
MNIHVFAVETFRRKKLRRLWDRCYNLLDIFIEKHFVDSGTDIIFLDIFVEKYLTLGLM